MRGRTNKPSLLLYYKAFLQAAYPSLFASLKNERWKGEEIGEKVSPLFVITPHQFDYITYYQEHVTTTQ